MPRPGKTAMLRLEPLPRLVQGLAAQPQRLGVVAMRQASPSAGFKAWRLSPNGLALLL